MQIGNAGFEFLALSELYKFRCQGGGWGVNISKYFFFKNRHRIFLFWKNIKIFFLVAPQVNWCTFAIFWVLITQWPIWNQAQGQCNTQGRRGVIMKEKKRVFVQICSLFKDMRFLRATQFFNQKVARLIQKQNQ